MSELKKKVAGWELRPQARKTFEDWVKERNKKLGQEASGAILLWTHIPESIRNIALAEADGSFPVDKSVWEMLEKIMDQAAKVRIGLRAAKDF
jgi:hypothetical protein